MRNVSRPRLAVPLAVLVAVAALVASACSTFAGPAWQVGDVTMSVDQFSADYDASLTEADRATTTSGRIPSAGMAAFMTNQIQQEILKQGLADRGVVISQEDLDSAELAMQQQAQQSGSAATPSDEDIANQAAFVKLGTELVKEEVDAGTFDLDAATRQVFEENAEQLATPAETCLHALFILVDQADPTGTAPTDAEKAAAQAEADAALARLATEDFDAVSADVSVLETQYPGGDLGCQPTEELNPDLAAIVDPLEPLALSAPAVRRRRQRRALLRGDLRACRDAGRRPGRRERPARPRDRPRQRGRGLSHRRPAVGRWTTIPDRRPPLL